jgi:hypothetical protein
MNFEAFFAETNKAISWRAVLQKKFKEFGGKVVMDTDYTDDMAILDNS